MKTTLGLGAAALVLLFSGAASAAVTTYSATLNGTQEVPAVTTAKSGTAALSYDDGTGKLTGTVTLVGVNDFTAAHIHKAACGVGGGVAHNLTAPVANVITVDLTLNAGQATDLANGDYYVNIHTTAEGNGEIRGQLYPTASGKTCPATDGGTDGGTDAGSSSSSSSSSSSGGSSTSSGGSSSGGNDASTVPATSSGTNGSSAAPAEDDGCSSTGGGTGNGLAMAVGVGVALAAIARGRRRR